MAEGRDWEFTGGDYDEYHDDADERTPMFPDGNRDGGWTEGRRPSSHRSSSRHQYETGKGTSSSFVNTSFETSRFDETILDRREELQEEAKRRIQEKYPNWNPNESSFVATMERGKVEAALIEGKKVNSTKKYVLFKKDGNLRSGLPKAIMESLGKHASEMVEEVDERDARISELTKELERSRKTNEELSIKLGSEYQERKEEKRRLGDKMKENEEKIFTLESEKKSMKEEMDEALRRGNVEYETKLRESSEASKSNEREKIERLTEENDNRIRKINEKYEKEISKKNERITALEKGLDVSKKEKKESIAAAKEDLNQLKKRKDEALKQAKEENEAKVEKLKKDNIALGKERDKFYNDKISDLKANYDEHVRETTNGYEERIREKDEQISNLTNELRNMKRTMESLKEEIAEIKNKTLTADEQRILEESEMKIEENEERIDELTRENEATLERLTLRERVKLIFKKHGLTALGIITAVGTVIGVVVSNLKSGLAKVAKGVGDGLKEPGKKLAQLLPGMIGAIAKYIFNTAGEVIGYLAKNTWLLIVAAVVYAVEQFKKKNK